MSVEPQTGATPSIGIVNIGRLYTGDIREPEREAEALYLERGRVGHIGSNSEVLGRSPSRILDANGATVTPGLIDCHVHPVVGDWTPRLKVLEWISAYGRAGLTTLVSQGAALLQGRPRDGAGAKLLAMFSARVYRDHKPDGVKVMAGSVLLEPGLQEEDFREMAEAGVKHLAEIGISGVREPDEALPMARWARAAGMRVSMHFGGRSLPGSRAMGLVDALKLQPDVLAHANGGSTARSDEELLGAVEQMDAYMEACIHGGIRQMFLLANALAARGQLHRLILGTDSPTAIGVVPQGIFRMVSWLSGLTDLTVGQAIAAASGNAQSAFRLEAGTIAEGAVADLLVLDAPLDSFAADATQALKLGDMVSIPAIFQDGVPMEGRALNSPFPNRAVTWRQGR